MRGRLPALANGVPPPSAHVIVHAGMKCFMGASARMEVPPGCPGRCRARTWFCASAWLWYTWMSELGPAPASSASSSGSARTVQYVSLIASIFSSGGKICARARARVEPGPRAAGLRVQWVAARAHDVLSRKRACWHARLQSDQDLEVCFAGTQGLLCRRGRWNPRPGARHVAWARGHALKL